MSDKLTNYSNTLRVNDMILDVVGKRQTTAAAKGAARILHEEIRLELEAENVVEIAQARVSGKNKSLINN